MKKSLKNIFLTLALVLASVNCQATSKGSVNADSCLSKAFGDSISYLITSSHNIRTFICKYEGDKSTRTEFKKLSKKQQYLLKFLLSNPQMTQQDQIVYGHFTPCIGFELKRSKREKVYIFVDLGLGKWSICDANSQMLKRFDTAGYELLHFCATLYPTDDFIIGVYNNRLNK